jgi:LPS sulfotransferase NodH
VSSYEGTAVRVLDYLHLVPPPRLIFGPRLLEKQADAQSEEWVCRYHEMAQRR